MYKVKRKVINFSWVYFPTKVFMEIIYFEHLLNGVRHREGGPALESDNLEYWYRKGRLHREDGPAIMRVDGSKEWFFDGVKIFDKDVKNV